MKLYLTFLLNHAKSDNSVVSEVLANLLQNWKIETALANACWVRLPHKVHGTIEILAHQIVYVRLEGGKLLSIFTESGEYYHKTKTLKSFLEDLQAQGFHDLVNVHESHALNCWNAHLIGHYLRENALGIKIKEIS
ncbi:MAG: hypothetical protein RIS64_885 [Bacteroidota bacterium]|jgi:hypothetical protein